MEIQQLLGFLAVARTGSFSKAAKRTFRTQPAISLQVQALEAELEAKLFDRLSGKSVGLTQDGEILRDLVTPLVEGFHSLRDRFNEERNRPGGMSVRVATHASVMSYLMPEAIRMFRARLPEVELSMIHRGPDEILELIRDGEVDFGITYIKKVPSWLIYEPLVRHPRLVIFPRKHPLASVRKVSLKDIAGYPLILPPKGSNTRAAVDKAFDEAGISYRVALEVTGREAIKNYVEMGIGISIVAEYYVSKSDRRRLGSGDVSHLFGKSERGFAIRKGKQLSSAAGVLKDVVRGAAATPT